MRSSAVRGCFAPLRPLTIALGVLLTSIVVCVTLAWGAASAHAVTLPPSTPITLSSSQLDSVLWADEILPHLESLHQRVGLTPAEGEILFSALARLHTEVPAMSAAESQGFIEAIKSFIAKLGAACW